MLESARALAANPDAIEFIFYLDTCDPADYKNLPKLGAHVINGERCLWSKATNCMYQMSKGRIIMPMNDDIRFLTPDWDARIEERLPPDEIYVAYTNDGHTGRCIAPIMSRRCTDAIGYFAYPQLNYMFIDTWLGDIGERMGRLIYFEDVILQHNHYSFGKMEADAGTGLLYDAEKKAARFSPHDLRDTFASWLVSLGVPVAEVAYYLGHRETATTECSYARWVQAARHVRPPELGPTDVTPDLLAAVGAKVPRDLTAATLR